jgi:hypothetical protein
VASEVLENQGEYFFYGLAMVSVGGDETIFVSDCLLDTQSNSFLDFLDD